MDPTSIRKLDVVHPKKDFSGYEDLLEREQNLDRNQNTLVHYIGWFLPFQVMNPGILNAFCPLERVGLKRSNLL